MNDQQYQRNLYIEKYFQCATVPSPTMLLAVGSSQKCEEAQNSEKIWTYRPSSSRSSKVIELGANRKCILTSY